MGNTVSKERQIFLSASFCHGNGVGHDRADALLVACRISNQLGEDVLIDELLYDTLTGLHLLLLLLVVAASVGLLGVVAAAAHRLLRIRHDERLEELNRRVHRLVVRHVLQRQVHEVDLAHLVREASLVLILLQDLDQIGECSLACLLGDAGVRVLANLPELVQVEVLAGVNLTRRVLALILTLATKEVFDARGCRLSLLILSSRGIHSQFSSVLN